MYKLQKQHGLWFASRFDHSHLVMVNTLAEAIAWIEKDKDERQ